LRADAMSVDWNGAAARKFIRGEAAKALSRAAISVKNRAKILLSVAGKGKGSGGRDSKGRFLSGTVTRSKPGEPPRKQTGRLRASVAHEVDDAGLAARVGTNVKYGKWLELGTKRGLLPRPWLRRALAEVRSRIDEILGGGGPSS